MKTLLTLTDEDVGLKTRPVKSWKTRRAVRCVLFSAFQKGNIALLYVRQHHYHKLPGGGVERGETARQALKRETLEEVGSHITIGQAIGRTVENRARFGLRQTSATYLAVETEQGKPHFTASERAKGFHVEWHTLAHAIHLLSNEHPTDYQGRFIVKRDLRFLLEANARTQTLQSGKSGKLERLNSRQNLVRLDAQNAQSAATRATRQGTARAARRNRQAG